MKDPTQICRGFTDEQWKVLRKRLIGADGNVLDDEPAWCCAVEVFERRVEERFLSCIEALGEADSQLDVEIPPGAPADCSTLPDGDGRPAVVPGFAIMALCCLLIETLQSFRLLQAAPAPSTEQCSYPDGRCIRPSPSTTTTELFKKFLRLPSFQGAFDEDTIAKDFIKGIRNGILHEAETRKWVIWRNEPVNRILEPSSAGYYAVNRTEFYRALKSEFEKYLQELRLPASKDLRKRFVKKMNDIVKVS
jgi:hypothetical protein